MQDGSISPKICSKNILLCFSKEIDRTKGGCKSCPETIVGERNEERLAVGDVDNLWRSHWESLTVSGREVGSRARDVAPAHAAAGKRGLLVI